MQVLAALLRSIANINLILQEMQNRQVAYAISNQMKHASNLSSTDFVDVANLVDEGLEYADDLCDADVTRLRAVSKNLRNCNQHLHLVQNLILSGTTA